MERWTKDARADEKKALQEKAWDLHLDCLSYREIAEVIGVSHETIRDWLVKFSANADFLTPPPSRQHFDVWQFQSADKDSGQQSYFGALPHPDDLVDKARGVVGGFGHGVLPSRSW